MKKGQRDLELRPTPMGDIDSRSGTPPFLKEIPSQSHLSLKTKKSAKTVQMDANVSVANVSVKTGGPPPSQQTASKVKGNFMKESRGKFMNNPLS